MSQVSANTPGAALHLRVNAGSHSQAHLEASFLAEGRVYPPLVALGMDLVAAAAAVAELLPDLDILLAGREDDCPVAL